MSGIPDKPYYKIGEVCQLTDTQPYVLRFWESEFPQLAPEKSRSGQRMYTRKDIDLVFRIKKLLYEEEFTIAGARKRLETEEAQAAGSALESLLPDGPPHREETAPLDEPTAEEGDSWSEAAPEDGPETPAETPTEETLEEPAPPEALPLFASEPAHAREAEPPTLDERPDARVRELEARAAELEAEVAAAREAARGGRERALRVANRLERLLATIEGEPAGQP